MILKRVFNQLFGLWSIYLSSSLPILRLDFFKCGISDSYTHRMRQKISKKLLDSRAVSLWYEVFSKNVALHVVVVLAQLPVQLYYGPYSELIWLLENFRVIFQFISSDCSWLGSHASAIGGDRAEIQKMGFNGGNTFN